MHCLQRVPWEKSRGGRKRAKASCCSGLLTSEGVAEDKTSLGVRGVRSGGELKGPENPLRTVQHKLRSFTSAAMGPQKPIVKIFSHPVASAVKPPSPPVNQVQSDPAHMSPRGDRLAYSQRAH
ncbi:hypothetical protein NQZ68_007812 [Dissostichus eleginoides]|nr:hypothetical protein NQZ68_007812 [Dissostichus eleginoides]